MLVDLQMAKLVRDDVVDAVHGRFDKLRVEQDGATLAATAPPGLDASHNDLRRGHVQEARRLDAQCQPTFEDGMRVG